MIASERGEVGLSAGIAVLRDGGSAMDAVEVGTARSVLFRLTSGDEPDQACVTALAQTLDLPDEFRTPLQVLCLTPDGRHGGASTSPGATYNVITADDENVRIHERRLP